MTAIFQLGRQGFLDTGVTWAHTWPGMLVLVIGVAAFSWYALRGLTKLIP